jgi:polysaccharide chain length determinant protein (PEP-CTERM system associated)
MELRQLTIALIEQAYGMWRYRWQAVLVAWAVALLGWLWVLTLPNQYLASARVYVNTDTMLRPLMQDLTVAKDTLSGVSLVTQALLSKPQLKAVAVETGLETRADTPEAMERLLAALGTTIQIEKAPRQDIFTIAYRDADPEMARNVVQVLLTNFMERSLRKDRTDSVQAQQFLQQQIKLYEQRLEDAENRLAEFKKKNVGLMPGDGGDYFSRLDQAESEARAVSSQVQALQMRRNELARQLEGEEPVLGLTTNMGFQTTGTSVDGPIAELEARIADLKIRYTDKHPDVLSAQQTLNDLYKIRDQERSRVAASAPRPGATPLNSNPVYQQLRVALGQADAELAAIRPQLSAKQSAVGYLKRMVDTIPEVEAQLNRLNRDYDIVKRQYDALVQRLESARLSEEVQADNEQVTFDVIEPPRLPLFPVAPNRLILFLGVLAAALGAGVGVAWLLNQHSPVFFTAPSLRSAVGLPVFGTVGYARVAAFSRQDVIFGATTAALVLALGLLLTLGMNGLHFGAA